MIAKWKWLNPDFQCCECRMRSPILTSKCPFCGAIMLNEEAMWLELMSNKEIEDILDYKGEKEK